MSVSRAQFVTMACPDCGAAVSLDLWLIIHADERPDLIAQISADELNLAVCPSCGRSGVVVVPLLICRPTQNPTLIYAPVPGLTAEQTRQDADQLVSGLRTAMGMAWDDAWMSRAALVPWTDLAAFTRGASLASESTRGRASSHELQAHIEHAGQAEQRYATSGDRAALEEAVAAWADALAKLDVSEAPQETRVGVLNDAGRLYLMRSWATGDAQDLSTAIALWTEAVALLPEAAPGLPAVLTNLGAALATRYRQTGSVQDQDRAVEALERAADCVDPADVQLPIYLTNLGNGLRSRYRRTGDLSDLHRAIEAFERSLARMLADDPELPKAHANLGSGLLARYQLTSSLADLDGAVSSYERAVTSARPEAPELPGYLDNLGHGLRARHTRWGRAEDLHDAVRICERAVQLTAPDAPSLAGSLGNLGMLLIARHDLSGRLEDLDDAVMLFRRAVERTPPAASDLALRLGNLAAGLGQRFRSTQDVGDLDEALQAHARAIHATPPNAPALAGLLNNLANARRDRHRHTGSVEDLDAAIDAFQRACERGLASSPDVAITASRTWSLWALERREWTELVSASAPGLQAAEQVRRAQFTRADKLIWQVELAGMHTLAGVGMARTGDLRGAAVALERGRARLLTDVLERDRADLERARGLDPDLVARYEAAAARVRDREAHTRPQDPATLRQPASRAGEREAGLELDQAIAQLRALPGYEDLLTEPGFDELERALEDGVPAVYLTVSSIGTAALILSRAAGTTEIEVVWADELTWARLRELVGGPGEGAVTGGWLGAMLMAQMERSRAAQARWHETMGRTLREIWDLLMGPIVDRLEARGVTEAVLIPGQFLALLPLHAACTDHPARRAALDRIAFRYAPSLRALAHARRVAAASTGEHLLALRDPWPIAAEALPHADIELRAVISHFAQHRELVDTRASRDLTLAALPEASVAHFACHGRTDWREPLRSGLLLAHDELLTVQDLLDLRLPGARLAVLSACETGIPGTELLDEVVALPSAFLQAGYAGVVASLWSVYDRSTSLLMSRFYALWRQECLRPAVALRRAQLWMRDSADDGAFAHPAHWAAFTLTGL